MQQASTDDMMFGIADLVSIISEVMTLHTGDVIMTGTPAGVGFARKPPLYMRDGDVCEVEVEGLGILRNPVKDEVATLASLAGGSSIRPTALRGTPACSSCNT